MDADEVGDEIERALKAVISDPPIEGVEFRLSDEDEKLPPSYALVAVDDLEEEEIGLGNWVATVRVELDSHARSDSPDEESPAADPVARANLMRERWREIYRRLRRPDLAPAIEFASGGKLRVFGVASKFRLSRGRGDHHWARAAMFKIAACPLPTI